MENRIRLMIKQSADSNVIHFYQRVLDKTVLVRFTTEFVLKIFALFYKKKREQHDSKSTDKLIQSIQATLFAKINDYVKRSEIEEHDTIEITFEKEHTIPIVSLLHTEDKESDHQQSDMLIHIYFKKISWDEINEFRYFLTRYLQYYLATFQQSSARDENKTKRQVSNLTYVIQELLQNANEHSSGQYDYELELQNVNKQFIITVRNFATKPNAEKLKSIVNEIKNTTNIQELLLQYMLDDEKHLGIISSIINYNIEDYTISYKNDIVQVRFVMDID
jgi:hypothetical protein